MSPRRAQTRPSLRCGLTLSLSFALTLLAGCSDDGSLDGADPDASASDPTTEPPTEESEGSNEGTDSEGCFDPPDICLRFVECIGAIAPSQRETVLAAYGSEGSCWCGGEDEAQDCYATCVEQVEAALETYPTEPACHESTCDLDELDPDQPYGPVVDGACPQWSGVDQVPIQSPLGLEGSYCAPKCSGLAQFCPGHVQTSADGACSIAQGEDLLCAMRCYVDSTVIGGTQCPCGARCQPQGNPDAENNMRGFCTFE